MATDTKSKTDTSAATNGGSSTALIAGASVLVGDDGNTVVHNQVVAKIAGLAVQEIEGVQRLVPFGPGQTVSSFAKTITRSSMHELGVNVEVGQKEAAVDVRIITTYGASIPAVADGIRRNVTDRIQQMTGLKVVEVNIDVVDLYFPDGEEEELAPPHVQGRVN
jgi:uncharacterized alkaline shock family protein YloU